MNQEQALKNLIDTEEVLRKIDVRHFVTDGTLLGFFREGQFLEHDEDIDFGVFAEDFDYSVLGSLIAGMNFKGFTLNSALGNFNKYFELSFRRNQIKVDVFFYRKIDDKRVFHAFQNGYRNGESDVINYFYPEELIGNCKKATFYGFDIYVPYDVDGFLTFKYGNWREVVKDWDWRFGPKNILK
jgi:phosphorylcholine metabolism protein LicD